jgi:hypothetical protein
VTEEVDDWSLVFRQRRLIGIGELTELVPRH